MAQTGKKVLLVDCDLRNPSVHKAFNLPNGEGLTNVLAESLDYHEASKHLSEPDLEILTSGPKPPDPSELLGSRRMKEFVKKASAECDMLLLDAPPVLPVTDSVVLSQLVDGIVIVLSYGKTTKEMAVQTKESLKKAGANILGAVINNIPENDHSHNGYGYYYGYDEESKSNSRRKPRLLGVREKAGRRDL